MSGYVRALRAKVGTTVLEVPTVSIVTFDDRQRVLLVRHVEGNDWTTPGGMIEPNEIPTDAAVREMWEETGLLVQITLIIGVFGGELCTSTYSNGDKVSWVSTVFGAQPLKGTLKPDGAETLEARYFQRSELDGIRCKPHARLFWMQGIHCNTALISSNQRGHRRLPNLSLDPDASPTAVTRRPLGAG